MGSSRLVPLVAGIFIAVLLSGCFGTGNPSITSLAPGGGAGVITGRLQVNLDADIPAVSTPSAVVRSYSLALPAGPGAEQGVTVESLGLSRSALAGVDGPQRYWLLSLPNDTKFPEQWNLRLIRLPEAWALLAREGVPLHPVRVGLVDTRVCADHEDLIPRSRWTGFDLLNPGAHSGSESEALSCPPESGPDSRRHGTLVAGIFAAVGDNGRGIAPVTWVPRAAPGATFIEPVAVRALSDEGRGTTNTVAQGIVTAAREGGARVVNLSLGVRFEPGNPRHEEERQVLYGAVGEAVASGALLVAAAGNEGRYGLVSPADHPDVMAVGAVDHRGRAADYSNRGDVDLVAPGGTSLCQPALLSTFGRGSYGCAVGTSMAAPHVAAAAALLMGVGVEDPREVADILRFTAREIRDGNEVLYDKASGRSDLYGWGLLDVAGALRLRAMPKVFLARIGSGVIEVLGSMVVPAPDGRFSVNADFPEEQGYHLVAWADSNRDGRLNEGDFFTQIPLTGRGRHVDVGSLVAEPYRGEERIITPGGFSR